MKVRLRRRLVLYLVGAASLIVLSMASFLVVGYPVLMRVDRALAPLESVFSQIEERQRHLLEDLDLLEQAVRSPRAAGARTHLGAHDATHRAPTSILRVSGSALSPRVRQLLASAEDGMADMESSFNEAVALLELGDQPALDRKMAALRLEEDRIERLFTDAMVEGLRTGVAGRGEFLRAISILVWLRIALLLASAVFFWIVIRDGTRYVLRPIAALNQGVRRVAAGDWSRPVVVNQEDELGELAREFNRLTDALQQRAGKHAQLATAGELLAGVAHELNNPLQAIRGAAELRAAGGDPDWSMVLQESRRASKLAGELVRFIRPVQRRAGRTSLNEAVHGALNLVGFQYRADGIAVTLDLDPRLPPVTADPHELNQVLVNLLGNAHGVLDRWKGERTVTIQTWQASTGVHCRVRDTGPGIHAEAAPHIFNPFFSTRDGAGLGLTVARSMIRSGGGDLYLESGGTGASFVFWLPAAAEAPAPMETAVAPDAAPTSLQGARVLLADDEPGIRAVLERYFQREGALVRVASGGREALRLLGEEPVDLVLLDVRMPDLDGRSVYRELLRSTPDLARRTIFLSGDPADLSEELQVPAGRILMKPVELVELRRAVLALFASAPSSTAEAASNRAATS